MGIEPTYGAWEASPAGCFTFCLLLFLLGFGILGVVLGVIGCLGKSGIAIVFQVFSLGSSWDCC